MSNRKLYMLKVACARLHDLKVQERRYKGALVKRACMHLLVKQGADARYSKAKTYGELASSADPDDVAALENLRKKVDWKSGFWGTALGKFLRPYFENGEHDDAYKLLLTQHLDPGGSEAQQEAAMMETLMNLGVEPSKWRSLIDSAKAWAKGRGQYVKDIGDEQRAREKKQFLTDWGATESDYSRKKKYGQEQGWIPKDDKNEGGNPYSYYGFGGPFRRSGYLTDLQAKYDPDFAREYGLGGGTVINNYYYGPDGKRHDAPPDADKPSDPSKPGAKTPGPDPNPDLPGLSTVLGTSDPGTGYLSGLTIDPKKISLSSGSNPLTTTGDPAIDLGKGSISIDPASLPSIDYLAAPKSKSAEPLPATLGAIDKASTIGHDLADVFGGGKYVDDAKDWATTTYDSLPDWGKDIADTAITGVKDISSAGTKDPSKPWTYAPK